MSGHRAERWHWAKRARVLLSRRNCENATWRKARKRPAERPLGVEYRVKCGCRAGNPRWTTSQEF